MSLVIWIISFLFVQDLHAQGDCRVIQLEMVPSSNLQMVVWIEDDQGEFLDTAFITQLTGTYGLGNRPGIMDFDSAHRWPYGRRESTFPVWSHRHGMTWPLVLFQNGSDRDDSSDRNLSHPAGQSSGDAFYCRPLLPDEEMFDAKTCATVVATDKGKFSETLTSRYPPRADVVFADGVDHETAKMFAEVNPFDAVSRATPLGGVDHVVTWTIPGELPVGNYVAWVEVNSEFDINEHYDEYREPTGIPWDLYGVPYRGQPSVVYRIPFTIGDQVSVTTTEEYFGYGDPDGIDGNVRVPDVTITTGTPGSGAGRLLLVDDDGLFRVRVTARPTFDKTPPGTVREFEAIEVNASSVMMSFVAAGDDGDEGTPTGYDIRYLVGKEMTDANFNEALPASVTVVPQEAGSAQMFEVGGLLPRTNYFIGVRAYDECMTAGPLTIVHVTTAERPTGSVDACFVATAAYGSKMASDVVVLRDFRDTFLRTNVAGELLVEAYYTFGPALAAVIEPSETLRRAARAALVPLVEATKPLVDSAQRLRAVISR